MKSRGNELEVSGGTVGSGGAATASVVHGCTGCGKGREKKVMEEQGIEWKGEKRRGKIGSGEGGKESRARVTMSLTVRCRWLMADG